MCVLKFGEDYLRSKSKVNPNLPLFESLLFGVYRLDHYMVFMVIGVCRRTLQPPHPPPMRPSARNFNGRPPDTVLPAPCRVSVLFLLIFGAVSFVVQERRLTQ